jgi:hypothetical protein
VHVDVSSIEEVVVDLVESVIKLALGEAGSMSVNLRHCIRMEYGYMIGSDPYEVTVEHAVLLQHCFGPPSETTLSDEPVRGDSG